MFESRNYSDKIIVKTNPYEVVIIRMEGNEAICVFYVSLSKELRTPPGDIKINGSLGVVE